MVIQYIGFFIFINKRQYVPANDVFLFISKKGFDAVVNVQDFLISRNQNYIVGTFNHLAVFSFTFTQLFLFFLSLGDINHNAYHSGRLSFRCVTIYNATVEKRCVTAVAAFNSVIYRVNLFSPIHAITHCFHGVFIIIRMNQLRPGRIRCVFELFRIVSKHSCFVRTGINRSIQ